MRNKKTTFNTEQEISNISSQSISYSGDVIISIENDKKIIYKKSYHNNGKSNLFKFIATCLAGNYSVAKALQPVKIKLFYNDWKKQPEGKTEVEHAQKNIDVWHNITDRSGFIYYNTEGTIAKSNPDDSESNAYVATLHFRVPFAFIKNQASGEHKDELNQICIYANNETDDKNFSASYLITDEENNTKMSSIKVSEYGENYTLIVDWKMTVDNKI